MAEFKIIETQEQLDAIISDRVKRERASVEKQYAGYMSPDAVAEKYRGYLSPDDAAEKYKGYLAPDEAAKKDAQIKGYETNSVKMRIAHETGIPFEMAGRLSGDTEADIRKDAETIAKFMKTNYKAPLRHDDGGEGTDRASLRQMLKNMKGE